MDTKHDIKGILVSFYRDSTKSDYLEALTKYTKELTDIITEAKQSTQLECEHNFVSIGDYDQTGKFICTKCYKKHNV